MPVAYDDIQLNEIDHKQFRLLDALGIHLGTDLLDLQAQISAITSALGGPDAFAENAPHSGLNYKYKAGLIFVHGTAPIIVAASQVTLTDNATNYVEVDAAGTVSKNTSAFTAGRWHIAVVVTVSGAITTVTSRRAFAALLTAGSILTAALADAAVSGVKIASASEILAFGRQDLAAAEVSTLYTSHGCVEFVMDGAGYFLGQTIALSQALTSGSITFQPTINGTAVSQNGLNLLLDVTNPQRLYATVAWAAHAAYHFAAGDRLGIKYTTASLAAAGVIDVAACLRLRRE